MTLHRVPHPTYQEILDADRQEIPDVLRVTKPETDGLTRVPVETYTGRDQHEKEKRDLWARTWQWVCRTDHLPEPGSVYLYEIADKSYVLVRGRDGLIRGFVNSCLHRGRKVCDNNEWRSSLRCPFHGFTWSLEGDLSFVPSLWDFPDFEETPKNSLPEVKVAVWEGFVFMNPDSNSEPLEDFLGDLAWHFSRWGMSDRVVQAHVEKIINANWKIAQEAFCEAFHAGATHPQTVLRLGDVNSQVDAWENFSRVITPSLVPSPTLRRDVSDEEMVRAMLDVRDDQETPVTIPEGKTARRVAADMTRERWRDALGDRVYSLSDAEFVDSIDYTVFPNFHPWGGLNRIVYRFRPKGDDHTSSIMEVFLLSPARSEADRTPARVTHLAAGDSWTKAEELGMLAKVFDQDEFNMHQVHAGLLTSERGFVTLGSYQEGKLRWFHRRMSEFMGDSL